MLAPPPTPPLSLQHTSFSRKTPQLLCDNRAKKSLGGANFRSEEFPFSSFLFCFCTWCRRSTIWRQQQNNVPEGRTSCKMLAEPITIIWQWAIIPSEPAKYVRIQKCQHQMLNLQTEPVQKNSRSAGSGSCPDFKQGCGWKKAGKASNQHPLLTAAK